VQLKRLARELGEDIVGSDIRVPKYVLLANQIIDEIETGNLKPGQQLPGEADMAAALPASLGTIQKALARLSDQGVVVRRHGTGTFVSDGRQRLTDLWHFRFTDDDGSTLLPVFATVQSVAVTVDAGPWAPFLGTESDWICIERRIDVNDEFSCFARLFVSAVRFPGLLRVDRRRLENVTFRSYLKESYGVVTLRVTEQVAAETMPSDICQAMKIPVSTTGLVYHLRGYGYRDAPLSYQVIYIPPNARRLEFGSHRG